MLAFCGFLRCPTKGHASFGRRKNKRFVLSYSLISIQSLLMARNLEKLEVHIRHRPHLICVTHFCLINLCSCWKNVQIRSYSLLGHLDWSHIFLLDNFMLVHAGKVCNFASCSLIGHLMGQRIPLAKQNTLSHYCTLLAVVEQRAIRAARVPGQSRS